MTAFCFILTLTTAAVTGTSVLSFDEAQNLAVTQNLDIRMARERLAKSELLVNKAWALFLPVISASGSIYRNNREVAVPVSPTDEAIFQRLFQKGATGSFNWSLLNGQAFPLFLNAKDTVKAADLTYKETEVALRFATAVAYYNLLNAERQRDIRQQALTLAKEHLRLSEAKLAVGEGTRVATLRSQVEIATAEQGVVQIQNVVAIATRALATLIGYVDDSGVMKSFSVVRPETKAVSPSGLLELAYSDRLDLQRSTLELDIAERAKVAAWTKFLPSLVGNGVYRWTDAPGFGPATSWQLGLSLQWTIFEGGLTFWEVREKSHDIAIAELTISRKRRDIANQVAEANDNLNAAETNLRAARHRAELARETASLVKAQFQVGAVTQLEVLDAARALEEAETAEALGQFALDLANLSLERVRYTTPDNTTSTTAATSSTTSQGSSTTGE